MPRQPYQHPFLFRLAPPLLKTFTHQLFLKVDVWNHSSFHVPFCQIHFSRHLSYRKIVQRRTASVISYVRVYGVGYADTSAKQRICVTYLARDEHRFSKHRVAACLGNARAARRFPHRGAASKIRCSTDAPPGPGR